MLAWVQINATESSETIIFFFSWHLLCPISPYTLSGKHETGFAIALAAPVTAALGSRSPQPYVEMIKI